jgi:hypothetical protein
MTAADAVHDACARGMSAAVTLRRACAGDRSAIARLAGPHPPQGPFIVAEIDGELRAALSLAGGAALIDPLRPASAALELLRARALQLEDAQTPRRRRLDRLRRRRLVAPCI